jgi:hypothetical protein
VQAAQLVDLRPQRVDFAQDGASSGRHQLAGVGRLDRPGRAAEQLDAKLTLQLAHLMRQRGLGQVELVGGAREMAMPRHGFEVLELAEIHRVTR